MKIQTVNMDDAYKLIKENIYCCKQETKIVTDIKFHHQTRLEDLPNILKNGILSKNELVKLEGRELTPSERFLFSDDYHVNGFYGVSVSTDEVDLSKMGKNEFLYDYFDPENADIIISKNIKAARISTNYYNEFVVPNKISTDSFTAINLRILNIINKDFHYKENNNMENKIKKLIEKYNYLRCIALSLKDNNLDIPLREVSGELIDLDIDKIIELPQLKLK